MDVSDVLVPAERKLLERARLPQFGEVADAPPEKLSFSRRGKTRGSLASGTPANPNPDPNANQNQNPDAKAEGAEEETAGARMARQGSETIKRLLAATEAAGKGERGGDAQALLKERVRQDAVEAYRKLKMKRREEGGTIGRL